MNRYDRISEVDRQDGLLRGELRAAANVESWRIGTVHDDEEARKEGFRGGLVSGVSQSDQFTPLALAAFGPEWFVRGFYSLSYRIPICDRDLVRTSMDDPGERTDNVQVNAWLDMEDGTRITEGVIGMGRPAELTPLRQLFSRTQEPPENLRLLHDVQPGKAFEETIRQFSLQPAPPGKGAAARPGGEGQLQLRETAPEPLEWLFGPSPWGGPIATSWSLMRMMQPALGPIFAKSGPRSSSIIGGTEVHFIEGPVLLDVDYLLTGSVLGVSQSPRAENMWWATELREPESRRVIASMFTMFRWLKSSPAKR